jgi:phage/plasmid-like protein (TIGR03299 family)
MSHELTERSNGTIEMAYRGETPWHGLGQQLEAGKTIEEWTAAAGMDWRIKRSKVRYFADVDGATQLEIPEQHVLFRNDTKSPLGIVSERFKVVQPRDVMEFFRDLTNDAGFTMETAGTMFGGRRFWALAHIGESAVIRNHADAVGGYLLLCTGADGTLATQARFTTVRVVCNNTLGMAMSGKKADARVTHRSVFDPIKMKNELGLAHDEFSEWVKTMRLLAAEPMGMTSAEHATFQLLTDKDWAKATAEEVTACMATTGFKKIIDLFSGEGKGSTMSGVKDTAWGWLNAVTEYTDFHVRARNADNRLDSAWFGNGDKLKTKALDLLIA